MPTPTAPEFNPFEPQSVPVKKPATLVVNGILSSISTRAQTMVSTYESVGKTLNENPEGYTAKQLIEVLGPRYTAVQNLLAGIKAISNRYKTKMIADDQPEALLVLPTDEKYEEIKALLAK